jgi:hemerythrin superfamily protein
VAYRPMTTMSTTDIVLLIKADHQAAKELLERFEDVEPKERASYFWEVATELVRHEIAEEHVVYPIIRHSSPGGEAEATERITEQSAAITLLAQMEKLDAASAEFSTKWTTLRQSVLDHASAEESSTLPLLAEIEDAESRLALAGRYEHAKAAAPSHPHPHAAVSPPGNLILDPVLALLDKARDAVKGI